MSLKLLPFTFADMATGFRRIAESVNNVLKGINGGRFIPVIQGGTTVGVGTYTLQYGSFKRFDNFVFVTLRIDWTAHTGTGSMEVGGLPFAVTGPQDSPLTLFINGTFMPAGNQAIAINAGSNIIGIVGPQNAAPQAITTTGSILITGMYQT